MPRRVLVRMKKLRRFLDDRIESAREELSKPAGDEEARGTRGRIEAFQEVREEFLGERLEPDDDEAGDGDRAEERTA